MHGLGQHEYRSDKHPVDRVKELEADLEQAIKARQSWAMHAALVDRKNELLEKQRDELVEALNNAATSLETIQLRSFGEESYLDSKPQMRAFAGARAGVARAAIASVKESGK